MPFWGQKQQKVKTRSIFVDDQSVKKKDLVGLKTNEQIRAARQKIRTGNIADEKIDDTVLEFRKVNELSEDEYHSNLNPLIIYEPKEPEILPKETIEFILPEVVESKVKYEEFKKNNLTTKYKTKQKISYFFSILALLAFFGCLVFASHWNSARISNRCVQISKQAISLDILKDDNEDCRLPRSNLSFSTLYNLITFGFEYNQQVDSFEKRVIDYQQSNKAQNQELKLKINLLAQSLGVEASELTDDLDQNKARLAELTKQSANKVGEFENKLKQTQYLDDILDSKKNEKELIDMAKYTNSKKIKELDILNQKYSQLSSKVDEKRLLELLKYRYFVGNDWKEVYEKAKVDYTNIKNEGVSLDYFGNPKANEVAVKIAEKRGFIKRTMVNDENLLIPFEGQKLQKDMAEALGQMFNEMKAAGLKVKLLSGFRGVEEQTQIFNEEFRTSSIAENSKEYSAQEIADHKADKSINIALDSIALPGYSRHHFGYTVDLTEDGTDYKKFDTTKSFEWMSKDNFLNSKKYGIIPSYPKGVSEQGPEPESWEFVFVGTKSTLTNSGN